MTDTDTVDTVDETDQTAAVVELAEVDKRFDVDLGEIPITYRTLQTISRTSLVPSEYRGKPQSMLAAILYGRELGVPPMTALQEINVIDGRPSPSSSLLTALVRRAGHRIRPKSQPTTESATVIGERIENGEVVESMEWTFTIDQADRAGLLRKSKGGRPSAWDGYRETMLYWRAVSGLCRAFFPDVIGGLKYLPEELGRVYDADKGSPWDADAWTDADPQLEDAVAEARAEEGAQLAADDLEDRLT